MLRFRCYWDDTQSLFGDVRFYRLYYYLSDDTVEVVEVLPSNCGRIPFPHLLRRMCLPKQAPLTSAKPPTLPVLAAAGFVCTALVTWRVYLHASLEASPFEEEAGISGKSQVCKISLSAFECRCLLEITQDSVALSVAPLYCMSSCCRSTHTVIKRAGQDDA